MVYGSSMDGLKFPDPSRSKTHGVFFPSHVSNLRHGCLYLSPILLPEKMQDIYAGDHLYDLYIHGGVYIRNLFKKTGLLSLGLQRCATAGQRRDPS